MIYILDLYFFIFKPLKFHFLQINFGNTIQK